MPKKDKKKKNKKGSGAADTIESVRSAVERALPEGSKERGTQIVDEVARAVTRVRESLEQHGVLDELGKLRAEVESLARRVGNLERPAGTSRSSAAAKPAATRSRSTAARSTGTRASSSRSTAAKSSSRSTAAKSSSSRSAASKPAARKPAASRSRSTASRRGSSRSSS